MTTLGEEGKYVVVPTLPRNWTGGTHRRNTDVKDWRRRIGLDESGQMEDARPDAMGLIRRIRTQGYRESASCISKR